MSWIKMRSNLDTDPDVIGIATATGLGELDVIGRLWKIWSWADQHSVSGNAVRVTDVTLDRFTQCSGFANAMREAGWLTGESGCLTFPNFDRHNGQTAKTRAVTKNRVSAHRNAATVTNVTQLPLPEERRGDTTTLPTLEQVLSVAAQIGCPKETAERFWNHYESNGWQDTHGQAVRKWQNKLAVWKTRDQSETLELAAKRKQYGNAQRPAPAGNNGNRNVGTANEGRASDYAGIGKVV